jgi:hypothetical protein
MMKPDRVTVDELLRRHAAVPAPPARYEACARCGRWHRLVRIGRLWLQPPHDCRLVEEV